MKFFVFNSLLAFFFATSCVWAQTTAVWTGADANDPMNWFNAQNWQPQAIPGVTTEVVIDGSALSDCEIRGKMARCKSLTMYAKRLFLKHLEDSLLIVEDLRIVSGLLDTEGDVMGGTIRLQGNWLHESGDAQSFVVGNGWTIFEGVRPQVIYSQITERFSRLVINKAAEVLTLKTDVIVENGLKLTQGLIETTDSTLLIMKENAVLLSDGLYNTGGNVLSYVNGPMIRKTQSTQNYLFPVGDGEVYAPLALQPMLADAQTYTVRYYAKGWGIYDLNPLTAPNIPRICTNEYWQVNTEVSSSNAAAKMSLFWRTHTGLPEVGQRNELHLAFLGQNNLWEQYDDTPNIEDKGVSWGRVTGDLYHVPNGIFTLGGSEKMFPPYFDDIKADVTDDFRIRLDWKMKTVPNPAYFQIERSIDGISFSVIATMDSFAAGAYLFYYIDMFPVQGKNYYRVKQVDVSGAYNYSNIVDADIVFRGFFEFTNLYPNPLLEEGTLFLNYYAPHKGLLTVEIYDQAARRVYRERLWAEIGNQTLSVDIRNLPPGLYYVALKFLGEMQVLRLVRG